MKHLKRLTIFVLSLIAVIVCALGLVACGDDKDKGDDGNNGQCTAHEYGEWQVTLEATCTTDGSKKRVCTKCNHEEAEAISAFGHSWNSGEVTTAATCTTRGVKTFTCTHDGAHKKTEEIAIDTSAHSWDSGEVTTAATCTTRGVKTFTCTHDGAHKKTEEIAIDTSAHSWDSGEVTTAATCTTRGVKTFTCTHDGAHKKTEEVALDLTNHIHIVTDSAVAATCVSKGKTAGSHCEDCDAVIVAQIDIAVDLNAHKLVKVAEESVAPTCTEKGVDKYMCSNDGCTHTNTVEIALLGHDWDKARTCVQGHTCSRCDAEEPALGHSYESRIRTELSCEDNEITLFECATCHDSYEKITAFATGHTIDNNGWICDNDSGVKVEGKCEYEYTYLGLCAACGSKIEKHENVVRHNVVIETIAAKCNEEGTKTYSCADCEEYKGDVVKFTDATAHNWVEESGNLKCEYCNLTKTVISGSGNSATVNKEQLATSGQTEVALGNAKIALDETVAEAINGTVEVAANEVKDTDSLGLTEEQKKQMGNSTVYDFSLTVGDGDNVDFGGGKVTVTIPYVLQEGDDPENIAIWYISNDEVNGEAKVETIRATYKDGYVTFETEHFSVYTVTRLTAVERCALYRHNYEVTKNQEPSCTQDGYKIKVCRRCGDSQLIDYVKANGHDYKATATNATCTENGKVVYNCANAGCDAHYEEEIRMLGHKWVKDEDNSKAATCTSAGYTQYLCGNGCGETYMQTLAQKDHRYDSVVTAPTCTETGFTTHSCRTCDSVYKDSYKNATGHEYVATVVAPVCETMTDGYTKHVCSVCEHRGEDTDIVKAAHNWDIEEATCGKGQLCLVCGATGAAATGDHHMSDGVCTVCGVGCVHDYKVNVKEATCTEAGYTLSTCKICGAEEKSDYVAALGHFGSTECERCHIRLIEEEFFNNALSSLFSQEFSFCVNGVHFVLEFDGDFQQYDIDFAELLITLDKDGVVTGYGFGTYSATGSDSPLEVKGEVTAVLKDGYLYIKMIMPDGWVNGNSISEEVLTNYKVIPFADLGENYDYIQKQIELISEIYSWVKTEAFPIIQNVLEINEKQVAKVLNMLADKFLVVNRKTGGYVITLNADALSELGNNLKSKTIAENLDIIFGEGSFAKLKAGILDIANSSLGDVVEMLEAHGLKVSEVVAAANKLIPIITGEDVTVDNLLGDLLGQNDFVLNVYIMQNSNRPLLDVINEMIQAPEGEEFTVAMLEEFIDTVGESNLYSFIDDLLGVGEINGKSFEEFVSGIVQSVLDSLSVTVETDNIGIVKSVSVSLGEVAVKNLFEAAITDFTIITGYVSDVDYNGFINEVKELSGGIRLTKNIIDQIFPDAEKTYYDDGSIKQVIVEKIEHDEKIEGKDENYYTKYITTRTRIETYSFEPNLMMDLYSDCGNWYRVELVCKYYCVEEYSAVEKRYENGELVDEREVSKSVNENGYSNTLSFMYNTAFDKYEVLNEQSPAHGGNKHNYVEDESQFKDAVGCDTEWGERHFYCNECGGSYVLYFRNGHNEETRYELFDVTLGCAGGIREIRYCTVCDKVLHTWEIPAEDMKDRHHFADKQLEGIDYSKICEKHYFNYSECVCGEEKHLNYSIEDMTYDSCNDENGYYETWYCPDCGLRIEREDRREYDKEHCTETVTITESVQFNGAVVFEDTDVDSRERHNTRPVCILVDPTKNCEEGGCYEKYVCEVCGHEDEWQSEIFYEHRTVQAEIDLSEYGAVCGEKLVFWQCACGEVKNRYHIQGGDFGYNSIYKHNEFILPNGESVSYNEYEIFVYKCAVTDPQCSFIYAEVRYYDIENCREYRKLYIGCDENGENPREIIEIDNYESHGVVDTKDVPTGNPCEYSVSSVCKICNKQLESGRLETRHENYHNEIIKQSTCTQFGQYHEWCGNCGFERFNYIEPDRHGEWIDGDDGFQYCGRCGIQNSNGANGEIVLEDCTDYESGSDEYIVGYYLDGRSMENQNYRENGYEPRITLILPEGNAVPVEVQIYDYTVLEGHYVAFSRAEVEAWAKENGYLDFEIRLSFVPNYGDNEFDYGISFECINCSYCQHNNIAGNCTCKACGKEIHLPNGDLQSDESGHFYVCDVCQSQFNKTPHNFLENGECGDCGYAN